MTIVGTRPELIKLCLVLKELDNHTNHILVHTGQNFDFELNEIFFQELGIRKPDHFLQAAGNTPIETIASVLVKTDQLLEQEKPDAVLIYGDTNSCLASIAVKRRKIPLFHMEAGNRCFDQRVPEEINRKMVDHLSDINMPLTEHGRKYLLSEGLPPQTVLKTGSCMFEILNHFEKNIRDSQVLSTLGFKPREFFVLSAHREENVDRPDKLVLLGQGLNRLVKDFGFPVLFSIHPRTRKRIDAQKSIQLDPKVIESKPLGFFDYIKLQQEAACVISDSGTLSEESAILGFPAVHIRDAYERPEGMEAGGFILSQIDPDGLSQSVRAATSFDPRNHAHYVNPVADYQIDGVSKTVVKIILSHIEYVQRTVWRKAS